VRSGLDVIAECLKNQANPQSFPIMGYTDYSDKVMDYAKLNTTRLTSEGNGRWCNIPPGPPDDVCHHLKVWDCDVLQKAVNPASSFRVDNDWSKTVNSEIKQNGGYTLSFWWKAMLDTKEDTINSGQMLFYSSVFPPRVLFVLDLYGEGEGSNIMYCMEAYSTCSQTFENFANVDGGQGFEVSWWYFVSIVFGGPDPAGTVPGGLMFTPIELTNKPMSVKELQSYYYKWDSKIALRKEPAILDEGRTQLEIEYVVPPASFPFKMSLVSPDCSGKILLFDINIMAELEADVRVDYKIQHYQSLEEGDLKTYQTVAIIALVYRRLSP
jgi:hypothetical protein